MAINFPSTTGQATDGSFTHVVGYVTYKWNGVSWNASVSGEGGGGSISDINEIGNVDTTGLATGEFFVYDGTNWSPNDGIVYNTGTSTGLHPQYLVIKDGTGLGFGTGHTGGDPDVFFDWNVNSTTGSLTIGPNTSTIATYDVYIKGSGASDRISILNGGAVELCYGSDGKRLETSAQGVNVTGVIAAESLSLSTGGQIDAAGCTVDFQSATISFSGATIGGLQGEISDGVDFHLNQSTATDGQILSWNATGGAQGTGDYEWVADGGSYGNSDVDSHLNISGASSGQILSWNGSDYAWVADQTGGGGAAGLSVSIPHGATQLTKTFVAADANSISGTVTDQLRIYVLPQGSTLTLGDQFYIFDIGDENLSGNAASYNISIAPHSGDRIQGAAADTPYIIASNAGSVRLIWMGSTYQWRVFQ
jgi:hypothetical protein